MLSTATSLPLSGALAQGTAEDYARSARIVKNLDNKVFRQSIGAHWLEGNQKFWYRIDTAPDHFEFVLVDAIKGTRRPAFDHQKLAAALQAQLKKPVDANALPFSWISPSADGSIVRFRVEDRTWQFNAAGKLSPSDTEVVEEKLTPLRQVRPSEYTGDRTALTFFNRLKVPIDLFWIKTDGQEDKRQTIQPGAMLRMGTYAGHIWQLKDQQGKSVGIYEAIADESLAIIEDTPADAEADKKPVVERRRRRRGNPTIQPPQPTPIKQPFVRDFNLWLRHQGQETQLTTSGKADAYFNEDFRVSPNGRYLIASQITPAQEHKVYMVDSSPDDQLQPKLKTIDYLKPGDRIEQRRIRLFDLQTAREVPTSDALFTNQWDLQDLGWDEAGQGFRFLFNQRGHQVVRVLDMKTDGTVRPIVEETSPTFVDYSQKTYFHLVPQKNELIWASERDGWNHLYLYDTQTGTVKNQITKGNWVMREVERVDDAKRQIWFRAFGLVPGQDPYYAQLARINFDGSGLTVLTEGNGNHTWKWSPDRKFLLDTSSRVDAPPTVTLRDGETGRTICPLETSDIKPLLAAGWTLPEPFEAMGRDGKTPIYGVIVRPSNFDPTKKYPVVEDIYAGPHDFFVPKSFGTLARHHELAELGFIVVKIDGMGTNWRSRAFHDVCWKNIKDAGFPDRIAWLKAAQTTRPWMDLDHVGIYGGSAGGQNALGALLFQGDFYKAAAADCGCHDNRMDKIWWNEAWMGWPVDKSYEDSSNVVHAKNLRGDLLLIVGELDTNVDPASTMQVVDALIKADKDFDLLVVPGADHGAGSSPYGWRRQKDFFVRHLLGVQPPARNSP
jgi:dipeptidyl aminopeptidase/acylaminoacyl peptidase